MHEVKKDYWFKSYVPFMKCCGDFVIFKETKSKITTDCDSYV